MKTHGKPPKGGSGTDSPKKKQPEPVDPDTTDIPPPEEDCCDDCPAFPNPAADGTKWVKAWPSVEGVKGPCAWLDVDAIAVDTKTITDGQTGLLLAKLDDVAGRLADSTGTPADRKGADDATADSRRHQAAADERSHPAGGR